MNTEQFLQLETKVDPFTLRCKRKTDYGLLRELDKIRAQRKELDRREQIIQNERSMRYSRNNWFNEEINSTELHL